MLMAREVHASHLLRRDAPPQVRRVDLVPYLSMILTFLISIPVAFTLGSWAFALWTRSPRIGSLLRRSGMTERLAADYDS